MGFSVSIQLGISYPQLTFTPSFFRGVGIPEYVSDLVNIHITMERTIIFHG